MKSNAKKITVCAAMAALSVIMMYLGSIIEILDLVAIFFASLFVAFAVLEFGFAYGWATYLVSTILAILLVPNKITALEYGALVGMLPILKFYLEKIPIRISAFLLKWASFNVLYAIVLIFATRVLGIPFESISFSSFQISASFMPILFEILGNICYLLYDYSLTKLIRFYTIVFQERVRRFLR